MDAQLRAYDYKTIVTTTAYCQKIIWKDKSAWQPQMLPQSYQSQETFVM